jgi:hypothetical protein
MLPTTQSISKETKGPSTRTGTTKNRTIGALRNVFVMVGIVLVSYSQIYNSSSMIAYVPESQYVPNIRTPNTTDSVAAATNASTALVAQKKDLFRKGFSSSSTSASTDPPPLLNLPKKANANADNSTATARSPPPPPPKIQQAAADPPPPLSNPSKKAPDALVTTYAADVSDSAPPPSNKEGCLRQRVEFDQSPLVAPWDPLMIKSGGDTKLREQCPDQVEKYCQDVLPLHACLLNSNSSGKVTSSCPPLVEAEKKDTSFKSGMTITEIQQLEKLFYLLDQAATASNATYWLAAGSAIGATLHHSRIPWDDDVDIYILEDDIGGLRRALTECSTTKMIYHNTSMGGQYRFYKIWDDDSPKFNFPGGVGDTAKFGYPFLDVFAARCDKESCTEIERGKGMKNISFARADVFPLQRRPFGRLSLFVPHRAHQMAKKRYGASFANFCIKGGLDHKHERRRKGSKTRCADMHFPPAMVYHNTSKGALRPWKERPGFTVEHLMDGATRLASVTFDDLGNEVRRSYADGLVGVDRNVTCFHRPAPTHREAPPPRLVPFLLEERTSLARNFANRSAEVINREVLHMLDRVEIVNRHDSQNSSALSQQLENLQVVAWNAERGKHWNVLPNFVAGVDFLILNEMDWGMARSGNVHTTELLAERLQMNYA